MLLLTFLLRAVVASDFPQFRFIQPTTPTEPSFPAFRFVHPSSKPTSSFPEFRFIPSNRQQNNIAITALSCGCAVDPEPVCATDGMMEHTFLNECVLRCRASAKPALRLLHRGFCCNLALCSAEKLDPVCSPDGTVFDNKCMYYYHQCLQNRVLGVADNSTEIDLTTPSIKYCKCYRSCNDRDFPICGTDGTTYANACEFANSKCASSLIRSETNTREVNVLHLGRCCDTSCMDDADTIQALNYPICDQNHVEHANFCLFYIAQCFHEKIFGEELKVLHFGSCNSTTYIGEKDIREYIGEKDIREYVMLPIDESTVEEKGDGEEGELVK